MKLVNLDDIDFKGVKLNKSLFRKFFLFNTNLFILIRLFAKQAFDIIKYRAFKIIKKSFHKKKQD